MKIKQSKNNDHNGVSHGVKCSQEDDRIPPLESNGQSLEQEHRLSCVFCGCSDASANFLDQLNGGLVPGAIIIIIIDAMFRCLTETPLSSLCHITPSTDLPVLYKISFTVQPYRRAQNSTLRPTGELLAFTDCSHEICYSKQLNEQQESCEIYIYEQDLENGHRCHRRLVNTDTREIK